MKKHLVQTISNKAAYLSNSILYRSFIAAIDQGLNSFVNLIVQFILIKTVTKDEFGYYSLGLSIIMYQMSFQNAVVNTPITVSLAERNEFEKNKYVASVFNGQFLFLIIICSLGAVISSITLVINTESAITALVMSLFIGSFGVLNREFLRSFFFAEEKPLKVLKLDFYYSALYLSLIGIAFLIYKVNVPLVIIFMGLAASFDSLILNKSFNYKFNFNDVKESFKENWIISKWALIGITVTHLQGFSYLYIIGLFLGSAAMGEVSASRLLLMPLGLIINGWGNVIRPYGAKLREEGRLISFFRNLVLAGVIFPVFVLAFTGILYLYSDIILKYFFTGNYKSIFEYLLFWAVMSCVGFIQANDSYGLQVIKKFKSLALLNAITMVITIISSIFLTQVWGIKGALSASLIGSSIFTIILWYILYKSIFTNTYE